MEPILNVFLDRRDTGSLSKNALWIRQCVWIRDHFLKMPWGIHHCIWDLLGFTEMPQLSARKLDVDWLRLAGPSWLSSLFVIRHLHQFPPNYPCKLWCCGKRYSDFTVITHKSSSLHGGDAIIWRAYETHLTQQRHASPSLRPLRGRCQSWWRQPPSGTVKPTKSRCSDGKSVCWQAKRDRVRL